MNKQVLHVVTALSLIFTSVPKLWAQPDIQWQKTFGGGGVDQAKSIQQTADGGFIVTGFTTSANGDVVGNNGSYDYWVLKLDAAGTLEWQKPFGGVAADLGNAIKQTVDGGYIMAGFTMSNNGDVSGNHGDYDYWIVKLDETGDIEWQRTYGGTGIDQAKDIQQTADGGYIVAGSTWSIEGDVTGNHGRDDYWIVKLDSIGDMEWKHCFGGTNNEIANSVKQTLDGGYIVAGYTNSSDGDVVGAKGDYDYWIIKLNSSGFLSWQKTLGGIGDDQAYSVEQTVDKGYIIAGYTSSTGGDVAGMKGAYDYWLVKLDSSSNVEWTKTYGGTGVENAFAAKQTADGGYVISGYSNSTNGDITSWKGNFDYWIVKVDATGGVQWQKNMGGTSVDQAYNIGITSDDGYVVCGYTLSSDGDLQGLHINGDYWIVKLISTSFGIAENSLKQVQVYPNPTANWLQIDIESDIKSVNIYNAIGQLVQVENKALFSIESLSSGIYTVLINAKNGNYSARFVKK